MRCAVIPVFASGINSRCKCFRTRHAKHQLSLLTRRAFDQFNKSGDMARNGQGIGFGVWARAM